MIIKEALYGPNCPNRPLRLFVIILESNQVACSSGKCGRVLLKNVSKEEMLLNDAEKFREI